METDEYEEVAQGFYTNLQELVQNFAERHEYITPDMQYCIITYGLISALFTLTAIPGTNPKDTLCKLIENVPFELDESQVEAVVE